MMPMPVLMVSHDQNSLVAPHFDHLYLKNLYLWTDRQVYCSALLRDRADYLCMIVAPRKMVLKRPSICDTGEDYSEHSLFRCPDGQSICLETEVYELVELYLKDGLERTVHHSFR